MRSRFRLAVAATLAATAAGCVGPSGPPPLGRLRLVLGFATGTSPVAFGAIVESARLRVLRGSVTAVDATLPFTEGAEIVWDVELAAEEEALPVSVELRAGTRLMYQGGRTVELRADRAASVPVHPISMQYVGPVIQAIEVTPRAATLARAGASQPFTGVVREASGDASSAFRLRWASSNPAVATVDSASGLATAVGSGTTTISASAGGVAGVASLTVQAVASVSVSPAVAQLFALGRVRQFVGTAKDGNGVDIPGTPFVWTSSAPAVARVSASGLATAVGPGLAVISAMAGGVTGVATLAVSQVPAAVAVSPLVVAIPVGAQQPFVATVTDSGGAVVNGSALIWTSSAPSVATVDAAGVATALAPGTAAIHAASGGAKGQALLTVGTPQPSPDTVAIPLPDLGAGTYLGHQGGLYEAGSNVVPADHHAAGLAIATTIRPLNAQGQPSASGKIVMLAVGMSHATQEFCNRDAAGSQCASWSFMGQAAADPAINHADVVFVDGAQGGQAIAAWDDPSDLTYAVVATQRLPAHGVTEAQVQVAWFKMATSTPTASLPGSAADAYRLVTYGGDVLRALRVRYPNLKLVFVASRSFGGFAQIPLHPEPFAFELGFGMKWLIQAQVQQARTGQQDPLAGDLSYASGKAPWVAWGPYLWARSDVPRSDGLQWLRQDFDTDGTHPSASGEQKVGTLLLQFVKTSPYTSCWVLAAGC